MKILGREPALIIGFIGALMTVLVGMNIPGLTAGAGVAITALVTAGLTAWATRPVSPALYAGLVTAVSAVLAEYGFHVADNLLVGLGALVTAGFALFGVRPQVTPAKDQAAIAPANGQVR